MSEAVATLAPRGAARIQDLIWPGRLTAAGPAAFATDHTGRTRTENLTGTVVGISGGTANPIADVKLGVPSVKITCDAVGGISLRFYPSMGFFLNTTKSTQTPGAPNNVTRIVWAFSGSGIAPNAGSDMGLEIVPPGGFGTGRILVDASPGWGFRLADANVLQFIVRGPNGLFTIPLTANPFDLTAWHVVDLRMTSASSTTEATLDVRLDGVPQNLGPLNSSWAAGSNLPAIALNAGTIGFMPCLVANPNPINAFWTYQLRFIQAPTVIATI